LQTYYEPREINKLLESLTRKGLVEKINYGTVGLCPRCSNPVLMITLACPKCGSLKVSKKELVKHVQCGYSGYSDEFIVGIHYVCPNCGVKDDNKKREIDDEEPFKVSDSIYECEDCRTISAKALTSYSCIKCKTRFTSKDIRYENPCGYRTIEPGAALQKPIQEPSQSLDATMEEVEDGTDQEASAPAPIAEENLEDNENVDEPIENDETKETNIFDETGSPEELAECEAQSVDTQEEVNLEDVKDPIDVDEPAEKSMTEPPIETVEEPTVDVDEHMENHPTEPQDEPMDETETHLTTGKQGFLGRIFQKKEEQQQTKPSKPVRVEKEVVKRSDATILLIEQDQDRADRIIKSLEKTRLQSLEVKHAPNGRVGLRELRKPYNAVIFDLSLSDIDPEIIVREISRWKISTPMIVITNDGVSTKTLGRVGLSIVKVMNFSEAEIRQIPLIIEKLVR
jgi:CheY-like chemotaxis protein